MKSLLGLPVAMKSLLGENIKKSPPEEPICSAKSDSHIAISGDWISTSMSPSNLRACRLARASLASISVDGTTMFDSETEAVGDVGACCCCSFAPEVVSAQLGIPMLEHMRPTSDHLSLATGE